jgi:arginyl-tRNA synthetase
MLAWQKWGNGETPETSGLKGDKLVGKYYVLFDKELKKQKEKSGKLTEEEAQNVPLMHEAQEMLRKWEAKDPEVISLWKKMNGWVYDGFEETYKALGVSFDKNYYESDTYLYGKKIVEEGLKKGIFFKKEDGSVWCDLKKEGLDEKVLLRSDGTSVYITQDIGTAILRLNDFPDTNKLIYTVGNEQDYHFKVLFAILKKLGFEWADKCYHLSYGMVDLPSGKMKSREGTVVDADDLIEEMIETAKKTTEELGKLNEIPEEKRTELFRIIGLGALKYFILKVDPKKRMLFDPKESIDFNGNTGPFIQYTYARIQSLLRKAGFNVPAGIQFPGAGMDKLEKNVLKLIYEYPDIIREAADTYNPAVIANYVYELVKGYNHFYQSIPVLSESDKELVNFRLALSHRTGETIKSSMKLLGIDVPERM